MFANLGQSRQRSWSLRRHTSKTRGPHERHNIEQCPTPRCHGTRLVDGTPLRTRKAFAPQRFDGYKWCQDCGRVRMSVLYQRGWNGSSCPQCTRVAAVTVLRGLSTFLRQCSPALDRIIGFLVQLEIWNADGWDRFFDPDDMVASRQIGSSQYHVR